MPSNQERLHGLLPSAFLTHQFHLPSRSNPLGIHHYCILQVIVAGYALSGGGRGIERVDISPDGGKSWFEAHWYQKQGVPYVAGNLTSDKWAWVLFKAIVDVKGDTEIVAKAVIFIPSRFLSCSCLFVLSFKFKFSTM